MASFLIFGITGDLARNKIVPALFDLYARKEIDQNQFICIGIGRKKFSKEEFYALISEHLSAITISNFKDRLDIRESDIQTIKHNFTLSCVYIHGEFNDATLFTRIKKDLDIGVMSRKDSDIFCQLAVPPNVHDVIIDHLIEHKIMSIKSFHLMIEKPFGEDALSAKKLYKKITGKLDPKRLILIDHYLGKEPMIDLINTRLTGYMEGVMSQKYLKQIEVTLLEKKPVTGRGMFYDNIGALKDVGQNHLLQVLSVAVADYKDVKSLDQAKTFFMSKLSVDPKQKQIFAQYKNYLNEENVSPNSQTETFFSIGLKSGIKKWDKTKFRITSGKALKEQKAEIVFTFIDGKKCIYPIAEKNRSAYDYIFLGAIHGNHILRADISQIVESWKLISEIKKYQLTKKLKLIKYDANSDSILKSI